MAHVEGDDLSGPASRSRTWGRKPLTHLDTGQPLADTHGELVTANAYLGGWPIVEALAGGADVVICPRITDASLVVGRPPGTTNGPPPTGTGWRGRWPPAT